MIAVSALSLAAYAGPVTWTLSGVAFSDGITASWSFTFNADAGTACSTGSTPCGAYSNVDITTTAGGGFPAETFLDVYGNGACFASYVPSCTDLSQRCARWGWTVYRSPASSF